MVVEERWRPDKKRIANFLAECEKAKQKHKNVPSRANMSEYDKLLLKYLRLKDFLRDCYPEVWKEFRDGTETKVY